MHGVHCGISVRVSALSPLLVLAFCLRLQAPPFSVLVNHTHPMPWRPECVPLFCTLSPIGHPPFTALQDSSIEHSQVASNTQETELNISPGRVEITLHRLMNLASDFPEDDCGQIRTSQPGNIPDCRQRGLCHGCSAQLKGHKSRHTSGQMWLCPNKTSLVNFGWQAGQGLRHWCR